MNLSNYSLRTHRDVREAGINPPVRYIYHGKGDGRIVSPIEQNKFYKNNEIDISVVIPIYNKSKYLLACLESVLSQTGITLEVICVDDRSSDGSWEIAIETAKTDSRIRVVRNQSNSGASYSRNVGISMANGRYLQFTDADDLLLPDSLFMLLEAAERTTAEVAKGALYTLMNDSVIPFTHKAVNGGLGLEKVGTLLELPEIWVPWFHQCYLISHHLLSNEKILYPNLTAGEDVVFISQILTKANQICITPQPIYIYRQNDARPQPKLQTVMDYIDHAKLVKVIYGSEYEICWKKYREIIIEDIQLLLSQADVTPKEYQSLEYQIRELR